MCSGWSSLDLLELDAKRAPAKRLISIEDVGAAVALLATDYTKLITGDGL